MTSTLNRHIVLNLPSLSWIVFFFEYELETAWEIDCVNACLCEFVREYEADAVPVTALYVPLTSIEAVTVDVTVAANSLSSDHVVLLPTPCGLVCDRGRAIGT